MKRTWKTCLVALVMSAGASFGDYPGWTGEFVPESMEMSPTYTSTGAESSPLLIVYTGGVAFVAPLNSDKVKAWSDMIRMSIQTGKKVNIYYDRDYIPSYILCDDYGSTGSCTHTFSQGLYRIQRLSLKPQ